jgi:hypothetical protein
MTFHWKHGDKALVNRDGTQVECEVQTHAIDGALFVRIGTSYDLVKASHLQPLAASLPFDPAAMVALAAEIHADNIAAGWWKQETRREPYQRPQLVTIPRNIGELLCLVHSEISEADHGLIGGLADDKLPHRWMFDVELADTAIRVLDILGYHNVTVGQFSITRLTGIVPQGKVLGDWIRALHRQVSDAMEAFRKSNVERGVECLCDLLGMLWLTPTVFGVELEATIAEKRAYNRDRLDHKPEARAAAGGKAF